MNDLVKQLLEILGLNNRQIKKLTITFEVGESPQVEIVEFIPGENLEDLLESFEGYELVPIYEDPRDMGWVGDDGLP